jgi:transposase
MRSLTSLGTRFAPEALPGPYSRRRGNRVSQPSCAPYPRAAPYHWDGLPAHRSRLVKQWLSGQAGRIEIEYLPAYAPELNPVEYIWGYCKARELPNLCPKTLSELSYYARRALRRMRRRPTLIQAFWKHAQLSLY